MATDPNRALDEQKQTMGTESVKRQVDLEEMPDFPLAEVDEEAAGSPDTEAYMEAVPPEMERRGAGMRTVAIIAGAAASILAMAAGAGVLVWRRLRR